MSQLDKFGEHEVLDRLNLILSNIEDFLQNHEYVKKNEEIKKLIDNASENLSNAYQIVGEKH